ncbi:trypsin-like peptidase domain-containing protein [Streptomyces sp. TRM 70351]|uniref:VMAP-C domain-containing protein n=1 Tax=Streptomyces sp. TRM 70351 TaxID=3116552 RepID=UPI002E7BC235|nr:trypsin-like peptidase domain-containing protein [Streptomyces sp. TRM 70351]MEE1927622.1 trypsin-like peptidase domain-containing protein [Streptomyces sp. TRM 70351]
MSPLDALVRRAVVRISAPGGGYEAPSDRFWGSGFFIAPTWVLTCAHVVACGGGGVWSSPDAVGVSWPGGRATGTVELARPVPGPPGAGRTTWPAPDLALVHVPEATDVECVWLSDRPAFEGARVVLHGWSLETGTRGYRPAAGQVTGRDGPLLLLRGERPVAGTSGGPLVDAVRGEVIGVCKARDASDPTAGIAVPVTALHALRDVAGGASVTDTVLAAHDRHHLARHRALGPDPSWTDAQAELRRERPGGLEPAARTHLLGRLAALTPPATPGEVAALVDAARRRTLQGRYREGLEEPVPHTWREGVGLLYGRDGPRELMGVVLYAAEVTALVRARGHVADTGPLCELRAWIRQTAEPLIDIREEIRDIIDIRREVREILGGREPAATGPGARARAAVRVLIRPSGYGDRHPWEIKLVFDGDGRGGHTGVTAFDGDDTGVRRAGLREALHGPLAAALNQCDVGGQLAAVEFVVPRDLFDEPFDTWQLAPRGTAEGGTNPHGLPLGQRRVVAVRDLLRTTVGPTQEWRRRWRGTSSGPLAAIPLRAGLAEHGHDGPRGEGWPAAYDRLSNAEPPSVPVFCGPAGSGDGAAAMDAALAAGHPVVIWRSRASGHTDCAEFHRQAEEFVGQVRTAEQLHGPLRSLRIRTGDPEQPDPKAAWGRSVALLYDPPDQPAEDTATVHEPYPAPGTTW